jgi:beta-galactosidase GanA
MPRIVERAGHATLMVDDAPYLLLGAQVDNSSGWPVPLEALWTKVDRLKLNTLEVPVYWEQFEPRHGTFDYTVVDDILTQARQHHTRIVLLWFGTWKNGKMHYVPDWVKNDTAAYPRMLTADGKPIDVLSPNAPSNLAADSAAFAALMRHLREADPQHTVLMMQVENESGSLGSVRDFSPAAQQQFNAQVPAELLRGKHPGTWSQVFGPDADETFAAWSVSRYINAVAAAGKKELPLPMYVNNWLKSPRAYPIATIPGVDYPSGGPTVNMHWLWKIEASSLDLLAPDIYVPNPNNYVKVMQQFHQPGNPLLIPESLGFEPFPGASGYARNPFLAIGEGAIGFANFGIDRLSLAEPMTMENASQVEGFRLLGSFDRELAALAFNGTVKTAVEEDGVAQEELDFGLWHALVSFPPAYDPPASPVAATSTTFALHAGRVVVGTLAPNQFVVAGIDCRVQFILPPGITGKQPQLLKVEEGTYDGTHFTASRLWNGDETDYGLNFGGHGTVLRVTVGTF